MVKLVIVTVAPPLQQIPTVWTSGGSMVPGTPLALTFLVAVTYLLHIVTPFPFNAEFWNTVAVIAHTTLLMAATVSVGHMTQTAMSKLNIQWVVCPMKRVLPTSVAQFRYRLKNHTPI